MFEKNKEEESIDLLEVLFALLHKWWLILLSTVAVAALAFAYSFFGITPTYQSTTSVYIMNNKDNATITYSDTQLASTLTKDYESLITSRYVIETTIKQCGLDTDYAGLKGRVSVSNQTDTRIINITVTDEDPEMAQYIANSIRKIAASQITSVMNIEAVNVVDEANLPSTPSAPSIKKWVVIGAAVGFFLAALVIIIITLLDDTIKSSEDVERYLEWSTLALIPIMEEPGSSTSKKGKKRAAVTSKDKDGKQPVVKRHNEDADMLNVDEK